MQGGTGACVRGPAGQARGFTLKSGLKEARGLEMPWSLWAPPSGPGPRSHSPGLTLCGHTEPSGEEG